MLKLWITKSQKNRFSNNEWPDDNLAIFLGEYHEKS